MAVLLFTTLTICLPAVSSAIGPVKAASEDFSVSQRIDDNVELARTYTGRKNGPGTFPDWRDTPVTRDPGLVPCARTEPVSGAGFVTYRYTSEDMLARLGVPSYRSREDPPLVDLYVQESLYLIPSVSEAIESYVVDKTLLGNHRMDVYTVSGVGAADFRDTLAVSHADGMTGAVLVGDLPEMIFEMDDSFGSYDSFPCDLYFMDLDGEWNDTDGDNKMDYHGGDLEADIWISRIKPSMFTTDIASILLVGYLDKVHDYFTGELRANHSALLYIDDDWSAWGNLYAWNISELYPEPVLIADNAATRGDDYIENRVPGEYEFIQVHVHSSPTVHYFAQGGNVGAAAVRNAPPEALFYNLFCCSGSDYDAYNNFGGTYMFYGRGLATIGSTKTGSMLSFGDFYKPMADGKTMGEAFLDWSRETTERSREWHYGMSLQGDGLLSPAYDKVMTPPEITPRFAMPVTVNVSSPASVGMDIEIKAPRQSLIDSAEYRVNGGQWVEYLAEDCFEHRSVVNISKFDFLEGNNTVELRATTIFEAVATYNITVIKDTIPPANVEVVVEGGRECVGDRNVTLSVRAVESGGLAQMSLSSNGVNWSSWEEFYSVTDHVLEDRDGDHFLYVRVADMFFNTGEGYAEVELDRVPPGDCTLDINGGDLYTTERNVTLAVTTGEDPDNITHISISTTEHWSPEWMEFREQMNYALPDLEGTMQLYAVVMDRANNTSPAFGSVITYDPSPPTALGIEAAGGMAVTNSTTVTVELSAHDNTSGVASMRFGFDGKEWTDWEPFNTTRSISLPGGDGTKGIHFEVMDAAGNVYEGPPVRCAIVLDSISPVSLAVPDRDADGERGWYRTRPTVSIEHNGSTAYYRWNTDDVFIMYSDPLAVPDGISDLYHYSVDEAGNVEHVNRKIFKVDTGTPDARATVVNDARKKPSGWFTGPVEICFELTGRAGSPQHIELTGAVLEIDDDRTVIDVDGRYNITYRAVDEAGNRGPWGYLPMDVDMTPPRLSVKQRVEGKKIFLEYSVLEEMGDVRITLDPGDGGGPEAVKGGEWERKFSPGRHTILIECRDEAGLEALKEINFTIEKDLVDHMYYEGEITSVSFIAVAMVFVIILLFAVLVSRRKRRKEKQKDDRSQSSGNDEISGSKERKSRKARSGKGNGPGKMGTKTPDGRTCIKNPNIIETPIVDLTVDDQIRNEFEDWIVEEDEDEDGDEDGGEDGDDDGEWEDEFDIRDDDTDGDDSTYGGDGTDGGYGKYGDEEEGTLDGDVSDGDEVGQWEFEWIDDD